MDPEPIVSQRDKLDRLELSLVECVCALSLISSAPNMDIEVAKILAMTCIRSVNMIAERGEPITEEEAKIFVGDLIEKGNQVERTKAAIWLNNNTGGAMGTKRTDDNGKETGTPGSET